MLDTGKSDPGVFMKIVIDATGALMVLVELILRRQNPETSELL